MTHPILSKRVRRPDLAGLFPLAALVCAAAQPATAAQPVQLAVWNPVQIVSEHEDVRGGRLSLLYGVNRNVEGIDLGLASRTTGDFKGLQWAVIGLVDGNMTGWQYGPGANIVEGRATGLQTGTYNSSKACEGLQFGLVNQTQEMEGIQIGVVNMTERMHGIQIGVVNIIEEKDSLPVLPIVNWRF